MKVSAIAAVIVGCFLFGLVWTLAEQRQVLLGQRQGDLVVVEKGVEPGERVIAIQSSGNLATTQAVVSQLQQAQLSVQAAAHRWVGSYALQIDWGDRHNDGIYSWDTLREIAGNASSTCAASR